MSAITEETLNSLVGGEEHQRLEFKSGRLLEENVGKIADDLSRAVSGFANAQGGRLIIGVAETKQGKSRVAAQLDGADGERWDTHRLQQIIESNVEPPIRLRIIRVPLPSIGPSRVAFVIDVPEGSTAHQARDRRYYARSELEFRILRDYEIRLRMHRSTVLVARLLFAFQRRRAATAVLREQNDAFQEELAQLRASTLAANPRLHEPLAQPQEYVEERAIPQLSRRWRYDEHLMLLTLSNVCERTIHDYDIHVDIDLPHDWLVSTRDDVQPKGGFRTEEDVLSVGGLRELRLNAHSLHPAFGGRLHPGMRADVSRYLLLVPEAASLLEVRAMASWTVYLADSPPSRGEVDFAAAFQRINEA